MGKGELPSETRRRRFDFWVDAYRLGRRVHEVENGPSGGLISLHVQAPCIIVACACRLGQWAGRSYHAGLAGCRGRSFFY